LSVLLTPSFLRTANFSAFEVEDEVIGNLREYSLANSLYWALAEGHACEQSARRNAMDVSFEISFWPASIVTESSLTWGTL
jgi:hypothetical protein